MDLPPDVAVTVRRPRTRAQVADICQEPRAIAFVSVEWSSYERRGRPVFAQFLQRLTERYPRLNASFWILGEQWEGIQDWFAACKPPVQAATGYGAVVWLERGTVIDTEEYAARVGVDGLMERTLKLWKTT